MTNLVSSSTNIVIDLGSSSIKCGYNGENVPRIVVPNVIGRHKKNHINLLTPDNKIYFGNEAIYNSSNLDVEYPKIKTKGKIKSNKNNLEIYEKLFEYIFSDELKVKADEYYIFIIDSLYSTTKERVTIAEILYEKFRIYSLHFEPQSVMSLYSTAKTSGVVLESGEIITEVVPIFEGYVIPQGVCTSNIAGKFMTERYINTYKSDLERNKVSFQYDMARNIKEKTIEIKTSNDKLEDNSEISYSLPDGNEIKVGEDRFIIPEVIFNPGKFNMDCKSYQEMVIDSIEKCDMVIRKDLYNNIILSGGNTLIKGFVERLQSELENYSNILFKKKNPGVLVDSNSKKNIKINAIEERNYSAWIGASGICSLGQFQYCWVNKNDYSDKGEILFEQKYIFPN